MNNFNARQTNQSCTRGTKDFGNVGEEEINFEYFQIHNGICSLMMRSLCIDRFGSSLFGVRKRG